MGILFAAALGSGFTAAVLLSLGATGRETRTTVVAPMLATRGTAVFGQVEGSGSSASDIFRKAAPSIVFVRARTVRTDRSPFDASAASVADSEATGSGFVAGDEGRIVTNAHVIRAATDIRVTLADGRTLGARALGSDDANDLALLQVDAKDLPALSLGRSDAVEVGDPTVSLANPTGAASTLTTGVVSAIGQRLEAPDGSAVSAVMQTDAAVNPGNAGGPLLDARGAVIGVNSVIATSSGPTAFAVPVDTLRAAIPQLEQTGHVER
jgi:S1-C subfamily serine protease